MTAKRTTLELVNDIDQLTEELKGDLSPAEHTLRRKRRTAAQRELDRRLKESSQQDRINDLNAEVARLQGKWKDYRHIRGEQTRELDDLRRALHEKHGTLDKMTKERDTLRSRAATLDGMLQNANARLKELELRPSGESDRIRALEMKLEAKAAANKALKKERDEFDKRVKALEEGYAKLYADTSGDIGKIAALRDKLTFWRQMFVAVCLVTVGLAAALASAVW